MARHVRKSTKLEARRRVFDSLSPDKQRGRKRPGSTNWKKAA